MTRYKKDTMIYDATLGFGFSCFAFEYKKTPVRASVVPRELMGETGVWKKITDAIMTTTLFTQFPTECVTGDTICNIMYDTC